jgi:hypothetical protein
VRTRAGLEVAPDHALAAHPPVDTSSNAWPAAS